jgi:hypothetical protein
MAEEKESDPSEAVAVKCPCCRGKRWSPAIEELELSFTELKHQAVSYWICSSCGVVRKEGNQEGLQEYYTKGWQVSNPRSEAYYSKAAAYVARSVRLYKEPIAISTSPELACSTVDVAIEVGAKNNRTLLALNEEEGVRVKEFGLFDAQPKDPRVKQVWLGDGRAKRMNPADLVCASHILEHAPNVTAFMGDLWSLVKKEGLLYIEVPSLELGGVFDKVCDDISRPHFWHFTVPSLIHLMQESGFQVIGAESDASVPGWPVNRIISVKGDEMSHSHRFFSLLHRQREVSFNRVSSVLSQADPTKVGLYGANETYLHLFKRFPSVAKFRLFDAFKHGMSLCGTAIEHPRDMPGKVLIVPRNSVPEIQQHLNGQYPEVEHEALFS